ncbi:hypothetical protein Bpfe_021501 [Biomphalaria pfeifferi]|uniref:Uncharacterized protein n=1 Tax=Biomphalaria pfeifferi TaxID=112525 RepID=A0AAD8B7Z4_BIOPF|nr:hypothetical protein Bpfe_021501 [Biomphalaria pfeifferi]
MGYNPKQVGTTILVLIFGPRPSVQVLNSVVRRFYGLQPKTGGHHHFGPYIWSSTICPGPQLCGQEILWATTQNRWAPPFWSLYLVLDHLSRSSTLWSGDFMGYNPKQVGTTILVLIFGPQPSVQVLSSVDVLSSQCHL